MHGHGFIVRVGGQQAVGGPILPRVKVDAEREGERPFAPVAARIGNLYLLAGRSPNLKHPDAANFNRRRSRDRVERLRLCMANGRRQKRRCEHGHQRKCKHNRPGIIPTFGMN